MSTWRRVAIEVIPSLKKKITEAENPYDLWITLCLELNSIYAEGNADDAVVDGIYRYGQWCLTDARNDDIATAACVCFYEHIPTDPGIRNDCARWLSIEEFDGLQDIFGYHLGPDDLARFKREFLARKKAVSKKSN